MKHSGFRLLLVLTLLVGIALTANGLDLFGTIGHTFDWNETKIMVQEEVVSVEANEIMIDIMSVGYSKQAQASFVTAGVDTDHEVDLLIGMTKNCVPTLNTNGFNTWGESQFYTDRSKPMGLLRTIFII